MAWCFASLTQSFWYPWNMLTAQNRFKGLAHWPAAREWKCPCTTYCALCVLAIAEIQDAWATQRLVPTKEGRKERDKIVSLSGSFRIHFFELSRVSWVQFDGQRQAKWARYSRPAFNHSYSISDSFVQIYASFCLAEGRGLLNSTVLERIKNTNP